MGRIGYCLAFGGTSYGKSYTGRALLRSKHILKVPAHLGAVDIELMAVVAECEQVKGLENRWKMIRDFWAVQGISNPFYMYMNPTAPQDQATILAEMPRWWADYYLETQAAARDPFFKICTSLSPRSTGVTFLPENQHMLTKNEIGFIHEASETGLISGFAQPVRTAGRGHFGGWHLGSELARRDFEGLMAENSQKWQLASFLFHQLIQEASGTDHATEAPENTQVSLSAREVECLTWLANGLRTAQIADRLGLANVTVDMHLKSARRKLAASTREQAIALAIRHGLISP